MLPVKTLDTIMKELGHDHVDILKLDVEKAVNMPFWNTPWNMTRSNKRLSIVGGMASL